MQCRGGRKMDIKYKTCPNCNSGLSTRKISNECGYDTIHKSWSWWCDDCRKEFTIDLELSQ
jgi:transposase-like protein